MHPAFQGCTALITGASAGLGEAFARQLAPTVSALILVARRRDRLESLADQLRTAHPALQVHLLPIDLALPDAADRIASDLDAARIEVDLLINNAGFGDYGVFAKASPDRVRSMLAVNVEALTALTRAFLPRMLERRRGWILQVSSIASLIPVPRLAEYAATKAYVTSFTEALRIECAGSGVRVTALLPGPTPTEFSTVAARTPGVKDHVSPGFFRVPVTEVVRAGLSALAADRPRVIPGWIPRICMGLASALPMPLVQAILSRRRSSREPEAQTS